MMSLYFCIWIIKKLLQSHNVQLWFCVSSWMWCSLYNVLLVVFVSVLWLSKTLKCSMWEIVSSLSERCRVLWFDKKPRSNQQASSHPLLQVTSPHKTCPSFPVHAYHLWLTIVWCMAFKINCFNYARFLKLILLNLFFPHYAEIFANIIKINLYKCCYLLIWLIFARFLVAKICSFYVFMIINCKETILKE